MPQFIVDTHVHLHPPVHLERFLTAAVRNLRSAAGAVRGDFCLLCLTDMQEADSVELLRAHAGPQWTLTEIAGAFRAQGPDAAELWLLPGRQIASSDGLEVLALDCTERIPDRSLSLEALVDRVLERGAIPVVPWGFGKWTGARGELVAKLIHSRRDFCVADNGNRLRGTEEPSLLQEARTLGLPVLLGSDPLPLEKAYLRTAVCGNRVQGLDANGKTPGALLREALQGPAALETYGSFTPPLNFFASQVGMQIRKHLS